MKRTKILIAVVLLLSLLLSSCGMPAAQPETIEIETEPERAVVTVTEPAPAQPEVQTETTADYAPRLLTNTGSKPEPTTVQTDMFSAKFEGSAVAGKGEAVDGVYRFTADETDGEAWHVKLECNYPTIAGRDYRVTYRFNSDVAGKIKFGDFQEFEIEEGENSVTGMMIASGGTSYLDLQLGMLPPFTIDFREIEVEEFADEVEYKDALSAPVNFEKESVVYEKHDQGYAPVLTRGSGEVSINYLATSWEAGVWKSKLFVKTGLIPEKGARYRVTADVDCDGDMPFELLFNDGDVEKGYGALYGQDVKAGETKTCEAVIMGSGEGEALVLQFSLGMVPEEATVKISNLHIEEVLDHYSNQLPADFALDKSVSTGRILTAAIPKSFKNVPLTKFSYEGTDTVSEGHDDGYIVSLEEGASSATLKITQAPADAGERGVWKAKLYAATGLVLEAGTTYRIRFDLASAGDQAEYEACFDGDYENAYGALYGRSLTAGGTDHIDYILTPDVSHGALTLRLQMGKTDTAAGNTVTLSNLSVEKLEPQYQTVGEVALSTGGSGNVSEEHSDGVEQTLTASGSSAALNISQARTDGGVWSSKMIVRTGVTPETGKKYQFSSKVDASADTGDFEILVQNAASSELYGGQWGLNGSGEYSSEFVAPDSGCGELVLVFQLGNSAAGNTVTVSDLKLCEVSGETMEDVELKNFGYPVAGEDVTTKNSFDLETAGSAAATLTGNGTSATAKVTASGDDWHIKLYAKPGLELEKDQTYTITMDVTGASGCTACYKNTTTGAEDGFGTETIGSGTVTHTVTPTENGTLEILLKLGTVPAGTDVTVSNVHIKKAGTGYIPMELSIGYPVTGYTAQDVSVSADAVAWDGSEASASGSGTSATLNVSKANESGGLWSVRLEANTGVTLEQGVQYRVSGTLTSEKALNFEVLYSNGSGTDEGGHNPGGQGYAEGSWGLKVEADGGSAYFEKVFTVPERSEYRPLVLRIQVGNGPAPNTITVSNIKVEKLVADTEVSDGTATGGSFALEANSGTAAKLGGNGSSATATVTKPGADWNVKFYVKPGVTLEADKQYQITMNVTGADGCQACYKNTATGAEDGFGTETIGSGTVTHVVKPAESGALEILLKIGNLPADTAVTVSNVQISEYAAGDVDVTPEGFAYPVTAPGSVEKNAFDLEANEGTVAFLTGNGSSATAKITKSGDDWHIKLYAKPGVEFKAGETYTITMNVTGANGCQACYKNTATGAEDGFGTETIGSGTVTHTVTAAENGTVEILLKLGTVPAGTDVTVSGIAIQKRSGATLGENLLTDPLVAGDRGNVNFWAHEDYAAALSGDGSSASLAISKTPDNGEAWKVKLFVETGIALEAGKHYRISADVSASAETDYEICYNNGAAEKGVGALYGLHASSASQTAVFEGTPEEAANLILQFNLGWATAPCTVTVSNVKVEEMAEGEGESVLPSFSYDSVGSFSYNADDGYIVALNKAASSAEFKIIQAPAENRNPWNVKLNIKTGFTPEKDKGYRVSFDLNAEKPQGTFEVFFDGSSEGAYGQFFGPALAGGKTSFSQIIYPGDSKGELVLQLRCGKTNGTDGNTYTVSNVKIEEVSFNYVQTPEKKEVTTLDKQPNYNERLEKTPERARVVIEKTPAEGKEPWKSKLFVETGVTLKAGEKYRVSMDVKSIVPAPFEVCFNNGGEEKGLGAIFGLIAMPAGTYVEYVTYPKQDTQLVIQLSLGNCSAPNSIFLSDVKVEKAGTIIPVSDTIYTF